MQSFQLNLMEYFALNPRFLTLDFSFQALGNSNFIYDILCKNCKTYYKAAGKSNKENCSWIRKEPFKSPL